MAQCLQLKGFIAGRVMGGVAASPNIPQLHMSGPRLQRRMLYHLLRPPPLIATRRAGVHGHTKSSAQVCVFRRGMCSASDMEYPVQDETEAALLRSVLQSAEVPYSLTSSGEVLRESGADDGRAPPPGAQIAVRLLLEQEAQSTAHSGDALVQSVLSQPRMAEAVLSYFVQQKETYPRTATYSVLIYACVKLRLVDEAFRYYDEMRRRGVAADAVTFAALLKGCSTPRLLRRGEEFFNALRRSDAPQVRSTLVWNARLNMHARQHGRLALLTRREARVAWDAFSEMARCGVRPDEHTYHTLLTMCSRLAEPDVTRALGLIAEMRNVGIRPVGATATTLMQVLGRANELSLARKHLDRLLTDDAVSADTTTWRPLLAAAASAANVRDTEKFYQHMLENTGKQVFDSNRHRVTHANNYVILANGLRQGFDVAWSLLREAQRSRRTDALTYGLLLDVALSSPPPPASALSGVAKPRQRRKIELAPHNVDNALRVWAELEACGHTPTLYALHRMFAVWGVCGRMDKAEQAFAVMKRNSATMRATADAIATAWSNNDLQTVESMLQSAQLVQQCHTSHSYLTLIQACMRARLPDRAALYVREYEDEAETEFGTKLSSKSITKLIDTLSHGGADDLATATELHARHAHTPRACDPACSIQVATGLIKHDQLLAAARVLAEMRAPDAASAASYAHLFSLFRSLSEAARALPHGDERAQLDQALEHISTRFSVSRQDVTETDARE